MLVVFVILTIPLRAAAAWLYLRTGRTFFTAADDSDLVAMIFRQLVRLGIENNADGSRKRACLLDVSRSVGSLDAAVNGRSQLNLLLVDLMLVFEAAHESAACAGYLR